MDTHTNIINEKCSGVGGGGGGGGFAHTPYTHGGRGPPKSEFDPSARGGSGRGSFCPRRHACRYPSSQPFPTLFPLPWRPSPHPLTIPLPSISVNHYSLAPTDVWPAFVGHPRRAKIDRMPPRHTVPRPSARRRRRNVPTYTSTARVRNTL